ncbi:MAG TPA: hypothetical protein VK059_04635 [Nocardioidaceae bacterium]|nr:hypothetical protein [Nocardioidaceae bacterium]
MFNSPQINEMMARQTMEYRAAEFEKARARQRVRAARAAQTGHPTPQRSGRRVIARLRRATRKPA